MDRNQKDKVYEIFKQEREKTVVQMENIYQQIMQTVMAQPPERMLHIILQEESKRINAFNVSLRQELKAKACEMVVSFGLSEAVASIIWTNVMNHVSLPKVLLCQKQDIKIHESNQKKSAAGSDLSQKAEIHRLETNKKTNMGVAAVGTVAEVITCMVVPGWTGLAGAAKVAGLVIIGAGTTGAIVSQRRIQEINRLADQKQDDAASQENTRRVIKEICKSQCTANCKIICGWIEQICNEFVKQCEIELAR